MYAFFKMETKDLSRRLIKKRIAHYNCCGIDLCLDVVVARSFLSSVAMCPFGELLSYPHGSSSLSWSSSTTRSSSPAKSVRVCILRPLLFVSSVDFVWVLAHRRRQSPSFFDLVNLKFIFVLVWFGLCITVLPRSVDARLWCPPSSGPS